MATTRSKKMAPRMAYVEIGLTEILLPADLAGKLIDLLGSARVCRKSYDRLGVIKAGGSLVVGMTLLQTTAKIVDAELDQNGFDLRERDPGAEGMAPA